MKKKILAMALLLGATSFHWGFGCGGGGGGGGLGGLFSARSLARFLGDAVGTTLILTNVD